MFRRAIELVKSWWNPSKPAPPMLAEPVTVQPTIEPPSEPVPRPMRALRRDIKDAADEVLELFATPRSHDPLANGTWFEAHDDLMNCDFHYIDEIADRTDPGDRKFLVDGSGPGAVWPVDVATISYNEEKSCFQMGRVATIAPSEVRGKVRVNVPHMVTFSGGQIIDGRWWAENTICGLVNKQWRDIGTNIISQRTSGSGERFEETVTLRTPHHPEELHTTVGITVAVALTERYSWHVALGADPGPRLLLPTNPGGCISLFRDREKSETGRRAALRNWVANHYRNVETSQADLVYVRNHLRGATRFEWRGLQCEVLVSQFDLEKNELFRTQAAEWRAQRKHNRVRLRVKERRTA